MAVYIVTVEGLKQLADFDNISDEVRQDAQRAINKALDRGRTLAARRMREQVNFPASYLSPSGERLTVSRRATPESLQGSITGRHRATSLARFASGGTTRGRRRGGVTVEVKPGVARRMARAFLIPLRRGNTDTLGNLGLAIRLKPGETIRNKKKQFSKNDKGLYLLYAPSVDQVFRDVAEEISPEVSEILEREFIRLRELR